MDRTPTPTGPNPTKSSSRSRLHSGLALSESEDAQSRLDALLIGCFSVQKLYGRDPGSVEEINQVFHSILGRFPGDRVVRAFEIWVERSQEFPTPADIVGLIRRKGKPPLSRELFIAISRKDGEQRTGDEWQYLRDYEAEQMAEYADFPDEVEDRATQQENRRLRDELRELRVENERLADQVHKARTAKGLERPKPTEQERIDATIRFMRENVAPEADIEAFQVQVIGAAE